MTKADRPTIRESYTLVRGRAVVVTIHATHLTLRLKGTRQRYTLPIEAAFTRAAWIAAEQLRVEKAKARAAAKGQDKPKSRAIRRLRGKLR